MVMLVVDCVMLVLISCSLIDCTISFSSRLCGASLSCKFPLVVGLYIVVSFSCKLCSANLSLLVDCSVS